MCLLTSKLPEIAFINNDGSYPSPGIAVKRGESGYYPIYTPLTADELNAGRGVTKAQAQAMHVGSMFGWHVPGADPDNYPELQS